MSEARVKPISAQFVLKSFQGRPEDLAFLGKLRDFLTDLGKPEVYSHYPGAPL
jgi:hypothetical protein